MKLVNSSIPQGLVLKANEGEKLVRRWGNPFLIKVDELNGGAKQFAVGAEKLCPGKSIHVHRHDHVEEIIIIRSGKGRALLGEKYFSIEPGSLVFIPPQVWHGFENTGEEDIDLLWIFPKLGMEQYFRATSVPDGQNPPALSEEELNRIRANHREQVEYRDLVLNNYTSQKDG